MENQDSPFGNNSDEKLFDLQKILSRALRYWYILVLCLGLSIALGLYIHKTTLPEYQVSSLLLISDSQNEKQVSIDSENALPGVNLGKYSNIQNQIIYLTSSDHIRKIIKELDFTVSYYRKDLFLYEEIYKETPFTVVPDTTKNKLVNGSFYITFINDKEFNLTGESDPETVHQYKFYDKISLHGFDFSIVPNQKQINKTKYIAKEYSFKFNTINSLVQNYKRKTFVTLHQRESSVYEISIRENNVNKGIDFLNHFTQSAVDYNLDKKNQIANNTINFIDQQLVGVSDSLSSAEQVLEEFRSKNELMDISMQGQLIINQSQELENQKAALSLKLDYYNYLLNYIEENQSVQELMAPSSMGIDNPILTQLISELTSKNAEKLSLQFNSKIDNPSITRINRHIDNLKSSILENTKSLIATTNLSLKDLNKRLMSLSSQIRKLPQKEQLLSGIKRKFDMNDEMYTFLLEKRSEAQLAKASNLPDNEIVERPYFNGQVAPSIKNVVIIVFILGIFLPCIIIFSIVFLNNKIQDKEELESLSQHPIIGEIPSKGKDPEMLTFLQNPKSAFAESIRSIRTSLNFYGSDQHCQTILVTSSIPGEGKSFFSINLGISYAQLGKKTIIIGFDLRKPKVAEYLNIKTNGSGLSRYLVKDNNNLSHHLIEPTHVPNLEIIPAGEIPPNPAELIAGVHTDNLLEELKKVYDFIIIDTPPIGLVTDAQLLSRFADVNIIASRHNYTPKPILKHTLNDGKLNNFKNICHIINDIPKSKGKYSYGYGSDYYN